MRRPMPWPLLIAFACCAPGLAQSPSAYRPASHADFGLPEPTAQWAPYHADPGHVLNQVFRALYLVECVPSEVGAALPRERGAAAEFFVEGWYFGKRDGTDADRRLFGGDGRQLPLEGFDAAAAGQFAGWLATIDGDVAAELRRRPRAAVRFQHDLLRLLSRLRDTKRNPELREPLLACAQRVALPRELLTGAALATLAIPAGQLPSGLDPARAVEIERRSTRLFDAEYTQLWSSVFVQFPDRDRDATIAWLAAGEPRDAVPVGTLAVLLQGIVALDDHGLPCATDLVIELRTQRLDNLDPLGPDNHTTTRDGIDFTMWSLPRRAVRDLDADAAAPGLDAFRSVPMDAQELFRDYGSLKHTTNAAQCALCHRRTGTPDTAIAGFSALRTSAKPRPVSDPHERRRRAEQELAKLLAPPK
ncbi:MAG: hypothetical protein R3F29_12945 [Planctomycetota bacterium]